MTRLVLALLLVPALAGAAPALEVAPPAARPGDAVLVTVRDAPASPPAGGAVAGRPLAFWRDGAAWRALAALPTETPPGPVPVEVVLADGTLLPAALAVREPGFRATTLKVEPKFVAPPPEVKLRIDEDRAAFTAAYAQPFAPPRFAGAFDWPRRAAVSGRYGDQRVFNGRKESVHYGLDLKGPVGAPVLAANDGVVVLVRDAYLSGNSVVLWHGAGVYTVYFHLHRADVTAGQLVKRGEPVGQLGNTGRSTGPHLHFGVRVDGLYVDPESILRLAL